MLEDLVSITHEDLASRKAYLGITHEEECLLAGAHQLLEAHSEQIVDSFFEHLLDHPQQRSLLVQSGAIETLKQRQKAYFAQTTSGPYDIDYCKNRLRVGLVHQKLGVHPDWYLAAYLRYLEISERVLYDALRDDPKKALQTTQALRKVVYLDIGLTLEAYFRADKADIARHALRLEETNNELQRVQHAKSLLIDMIVHDLQNPLTGIQAAVQWLSSQSSRLDEEERQALTEALDRCHDLKGMILNVLQLSRADSGDLKPKRERVELLSVAEDGARAFRLATQRNSGNIRVVSEGSPVAVGDRALTSRILENLLRNCVRHTPAGTEVTIKVSGNGDGRATLSVSDNGPGIPSEAIPYLFEPGLQDPGKSALRADSGLGLPFCRMAAKSMGGAVHIESGSGGTTFEVSLPATPTHRQGTDRS